VCADKDSNLFKAMYKDLYPTTANVPKWKILKRAWADGAIEGTMSLQEETVEGATLSAYDATEAAVTPAN